MAILFISDASSDTLAHYDAATQQLTAVGQGQPKGRKSHVAVPKGMGYLVVEVWESSSDLERFFQTLKPILAKLGAPDFSTRPTQIYPIHNFVVNG